MYEKPIEAIATVEEQINDSIVQVALPNGKLIPAHKAKGLNLELSELKKGDQLRLEMTPFDFDKGRIVEVL